MKFPRPVPTAAALLCGVAALTGTVFLVAGCDRGAGGDALPAGDAGAGADPVAAADAPAVDLPDGPVFEDATAAAGLNFLRFEGRTPEPNGYIEGGRRMFEWSGGGVAALDFDADGRPDLALTQGREWGPQNDPPPTDPDPAAEYRDRLFRNVDGGGFADVTDAAGFLSTGFGHGVAAGDYNGDGFPDLYICNAGANRLLRNDGDGTFTDVTDAAGLGEDAGSGRAAAWTISAAFADLSGDGLPDIYDTNYEEGDDLFTRICAAQELGQEPRICGPWTFAAADDRFLLNLGDGTFADVTEESGVPMGPGVAGPSLGIVAADYDGAAGNELFLAVDQRPNHILVRETPAGDRGGPPGVGRIPKFSQQGWAANVAAAGPAGSDEYACMGVALADVNADGRPDLFVTNYSNQPNTLYQNLSEPGALLFEDRTAAAGLYDPGFETLGFGAQFLDADRDGDPDLAYVNGHLDDFTHAGSPFFMKPTFLLNDGAGGYGMVPHAVAGEFFERPDLGRGLARLDWDGDGRDELVATHMARPARLLRNALAGGEGVGLRVVNAGGDRDAVGAKVTVTVPSGAGERAPRGPRSAFVTGGGGYASVNESLLNVGLGDAPAGTALAVEVTWPDGTEEAFAGVTAGGRFLLTRGRGTAVAVR